MKTAGILALIVAVLIFTITTFLDDKQFENEWQYNGNPTHNGRFIIRFSSGRMMYANYFDGIWHDEIGLLLDRSDFECWHEVLI